MRYIGTDREEEAIEWAAERFNIGSTNSFCRAFSAVDRFENIVFVVVLSNFTPTNVDVNVVAEEGGRWISTREFLKMFNHVFGYVFDTLGAQRSTGLTSSKNLRARRFIRGVGFKPEGRMRKAFKGDDLCIYGLLAEEFYTHPWYRGNYGHSKNS